MQIEKKRKTKINLIFCIYNKYMNSKLIFVYAMGYFQTFPDRWVFYLSLKSWHSALNKTYPSAPYCINTFLPEGTQKNLTTVFLQLSTQTQ